MSSKEQIATELQTLHKNLNPKRYVLLDNPNPDIRKWGPLPNNAYLQTLEKMLELLPAIRQEFEDLSEELETKSYSKLFVGLKFKSTAERNYDEFLELKELRELLVVNIENLKYLIKMIEMFKADAQRYFDNADFCYSVKYLIWNRAIQFRYAYVRLYEYMND